MTKRAKQLWGRVRKMAKVAVAVSRFQDREPAKINVDLPNFEAVRKAILYPPGSRSRAHINIIINTIRHIKFFQEQNLTEPQLDAIARIIRMETYPVAFTLICEQGAIGDKFYVIGAGIVDIKVKVTSSDRVVARLKAGNCFGELAMFDRDHKRQASVITRSPTVFFTLDRESYARTIHQFHSEMFKHTFDFVASCPVFQELTQKQIRLLVVVMNIRSFRVEETIFEQGEEMDPTAFLAVGFKGEFRVEKRTRDGNIVPLCILGPKHPITDISAFVIKDSVKSPCMYSYSVIANTNCEMLTLSKHDLLRRLDKLCVERIVHQLLTLPTDDQLAELARRQDQWDGYKASLLDDVMRSSEERKKKKVPVPPSSPIRLPNKRRTIPPPEHRKVLPQKKSIKSPLPPNTKESFINRKASMSEALNYNPQEMQDLLSNMSPDAWEAASKGEYLRNKLDEVHTSWDSSQNTKKKIVNEYPQNSRRIIRPRASVPDLPPMTIDAIERPIKPVNRGFLSARSTHSSKWYDFSTKSMHLSQSNSDAKTPIVQPVPNLLQRESPFRPAANWEFEELKIPVDSWASFSYGPILPWAKGGSAVRGSHTGKTPTISAGLRPDTASLLNADTVFKNYRESLVSARANIRNIEWTKLPRLRKNRRSGTSTPTRSSMLGSRNNSNANSRTGLSAVEAIRQKMNAIPIPERTTVSFSINTHNTPSPPLRRSGKFGSGESLDLSSPRRSLAGNQRQLHHINSPNQSSGLRKSVNEGSVLNTLNHSPSINSPLPTDSSVLSLDINQTNNEDLQSETYDDIPDLTRQKMEESLRIALGIPNNTFEDREEIEKTTHDEMETHRAIIMRSMGASPPEVVSLPSSFKRRNEPDIPPQLLGALKESVCSSIAPSITPRTPAQSRLTPRTPTTSSRITSNKSRLSYLGNARQLKIIP